MPNWCSNNLVVRGDEATLKEIDAKYFSPFLFEKVIPMPNELLTTTAPSHDCEKFADSMIEKYGAPDWYMWRVNNWGTKWEADKNTIQKTTSKDEISLSFDTAWSPPIPVVRELAKQFPSLDFSLKYFDLGCCFAGDFTAYNGSENDDCWEDENSKEYQDIAEFFGWKIEEEVA